MFVQVQQTRITGTIKDSQMKRHPLLPKHRISSVKKSHR